MDSYPTSGQLYLCVLPMLGVLQEGNHLLKHFLKSLWALRETNAAI